MTKLSQLPTLYFAVMMFIHLLDHLLWNSSTAQYRTRTKGRHPLSEVVKNASFAVMVISTISVFWFFRHTAWGIEGPVWKKWGYKWRKSWNIRD